MCTFVPTLYRVDGRAHDVRRRSDVRIASARALGLYVRDRRQQLGMTQVDLAAVAGVSRRWLVSLETGKPTAQIGLVLSTLDALGLALDAGGEYIEPGGVDLDALLRGLGGQNRG